MRIDRPLPCGLPNHTITSANPCQEKSMIYFVFCHFFQRTFVISFHVLQIDAILNLCYTHLSGAGQSNFPIEEHPFGQLRGF